MAKEYAARQGQKWCSGRAASKIAVAGGRHRSKGGQAALRGGRDRSCGVQEPIDTAVREFGDRRADLQRGISMRAIFDDVELDVLHKLMDVNFWGHGQLLQIRAAVSSGVEGLDRRHFVRRGAARTARTHGLFGLNTP